jgi:cyclophilin family peptidyl-prolyl cis-trans isomerase
LIPTLLAGPPTGPTAGDYPPEAVANERRQRQKQLQQAKKQAEKKAASRKELYRRLRIAFGMGGVVVVLLLILNVMSDREPTQPSGYQAMVARPTACGADAPDEQTMERFTEVADQALSEPVAVVVATSCGDITVEIDPALAPESANAFVFLARQGAYDGTVFHLVSSDLWIQGGDPDTSGRGSFLDGVRVPDEFPDEDLMKRGAFGLFGDVATRGSGFFIVTGDDPPLSSRFNVIGEVIDGFEALDSITEIDTRSGTPVETVYVESMTVAGG